MAVPTLQSVKVISAVIISLTLLQLLCKPMVCAYVAKRQAFRVTPGPRPSANNQPVAKYQDTYQVPEEGGGDNGGNAGGSGGYPASGEGGGATGGYPAAGVPSGTYGPPKAHHGLKNAFDFTAIFDDVFALVIGVTTAKIGLVNKKIEASNSKLTIIHDVIHVNGTDH